MEYFHFIINACNHLISLVHIHASFFVRILTELYACLLDLRFYLNFLQLLGVILRNLEALLYEYKDF